MMKNLTTPFHFSRKYGLLSYEEAEEDAKKIEELAFAAADELYKYPDGDGCSASLNSRILTEVYLSYLLLEDERTKALAGALKDFASSLEVLEVAGNYITVIVKCLPLARLMAFMLISTSFN
ncbi:hypothetical protein V6N12_072938 [Hibiscus sabdariffa]|uniref:WPP domain-containing protein n=1 Tax=Hibiscus sabdariffa TaxID=183260 RepID=A0ABR2B6D4_9ROSI